MFLKIAVDLVAMARKTRHCVYSGCVLVNSCSWARVSISQFAGHGDRESPCQSRSQPPPALLIRFLVFSWDLQSSAGTVTVVQIQ